jgi:hypothetical protein
MVAISPSVKSGSGITSNQHSERRRVKPTNPWAEHFRELAQTMLPEDGSTDIWDDDAGHVILQISWGLAADGSGVRHQSHPVRIVVTREALEDYAAGSTRERSKADRRFQSWVKTRLRGFRPKPSQSSGGPPPGIWIVGPLELSPFSG